VEPTTVLKQEVHMLSMMKKMIVVRDHVNQTIPVKLVRVIVSLIMTAPILGFGVEIILAKILIIFLKISFG
jgi:hypothetical protein